MTEEKFLNEMVFRQLKMHQLRKAIDNQEDLGVKLRMVDELIRTMDRVQELQDWNTERVLTQLRKAGTH